MFLRVKENNIDQSLDLQRKKLEKINKIETKP